MKIPKYIQNKIKQQNEACKKETRIKSVNISDNISVMNGIYDLRIDLDRLKHFEEKQDNYKVNEYKDLIVKHANELVYDQDPYSKELQVKEILSKEIFEKMSDQGAAQVLRSILLADRNNVIDWGQAFYFIQKYMPELKMFD